MASSVKKLSQSILRLSINQNSYIQRRCIQTTVPLAFRVTSVLGGEPMKKRKKVDANLLLQKELKKKKKIEKMIKRLEKFGRKLKPVDEIVGDLQIKKEKDLRKREPVILTEEQKEERALLIKEWSRYKQIQYKIECVAIQKLVDSQQKALEELKEVSEELYKEAVKIDEGLIPFTHKGPVETPPIVDYDSPDGEYIDTTKKY